jgi:thiamine pyrophosphate-dependent acetolactate synthase large subunit-like protein
MPAHAKPAATTSPKNLVLERGQAVPALIGRHEDFLIIAGLGGTASDVGAVAGDAANVYSLGGAMGAAAMMGLGLALARPDKRVLVVTGDGELLMNVGALATIAIADPANLAILCVDNGHYGETGWQKSHTSLGVDLEKIAIGCGIKHTRTVAGASDIAGGARFLREANGASFVCLRVKPTEPPAFRRNFDASLQRDRFRAALGERTQLATSPSLRTRTP